MPHSLVVICTTARQMETALIKSRLEAEGIPVQVAQESGATVYGFSVGPMAHADILVPEERAEEAKAIIKEMQGYENQNPNSQGPTSNS